VWGNCTEQEADVLFLIYVDYVNWKMLEKEKISEIL